MPVHKMNSLLQTLPFLVIALVLSLALGNAAYVSLEASRQLCKGDWKVPRCSPALQEIFCSSLGSTHSHLLTQSTQASLFCV